MTTLPDLIARIEAAGPHRALDAEIARDVVGLKIHDWPEWIEGRSGMHDFPALHPTPHYTGSVDAALTLFGPKRWLKIEIGTQDVPGVFDWPVIEIGDQTNGATIWKGQARTLPLTLCVAALKARLP